MVVLPEDPIELADYLNTLYQSEIPPWVNEASFRQFGNYVGQVINKGTPEKVIRKWDVAGNMDRWLDKHGGSFDDYAFIPIHSRYRDAFVGLRKADKAFIDIVEIQPPNG
jgi:hypothetical protein